MHIYFDCNQRDMHSLTRINRIAGSDVIAARKDSLLFDPNPLSKPPIRPTMYLLKPIVISRCHSLDSPQNLGELANIHHPSLYTDSRGPQNFLHSFVWEYRLGIF